MSLIHAVNPIEDILNRFESIRNWAGQAIRQSKVGLGLGLAVSALAGAPMPLPQLSLLGPLLATCAAGALGGRAAAAVGFVSFLLNRPGPGATLAAGAIAVFVGWAIPALVAKSRESYEEPEAESEGASAVVVDCDGFSSLDETYGEGTSSHVFNLLHRALKMETRDSDMVVHSQGHELVLVLDGSSPAVAQAVMTRVERRFGAWLADAGYECNLSVGLANMDENEDEFNELLRASRRSQGPYLD